MEDPRFVARYDSFNSWGRDNDFYLDRVLRSPSTVDVGCGTGTLLCRARADGHSGDLIGVDPSPDMLAIAGGKRQDIDWVLAEAQSMALGRTFDLVTMTGHAFQELLTDEDIRAALASFRRHLNPGGRLVFETRDPAAEAWTRWTPEHSRTVVDDVEVWHEVLSVEGGLVTFATTMRSLVDGSLATAEGPLRFVSGERLRELVVGAGFRVEGWYGDWDGSTNGSEIIVVAEPV